MDADWLGSSNADQPERYTMNFGFRRRDEPDLAPPRANAKQFHEAHLEDAFSIRLGLSTMDKRLPLTLSLSSTARAIVADADFENFQLAVPEATERRVGRAALVELELANQGAEELVGEVVLADSTFGRSTGKSGQRVDAGRHSATTRAITALSASGRSLRPRKTPFCYSFPVTLHGSISSSLRTPDTTSAWSVSAFRSRSTRMKLAHCDCC
jgi:hypothetical protein